MIHTVSTLGIQSPARFALTLEAPFSVSTEALLTEAQVLEAFVDIDTLTLLRVESEAARTGAKPTLVCNAVMRTLFFNMFL